MSIFFIDIEIITLFVCGWNWKRKKENFSNKASKVFYELLQILERFSIFYFYVLYVRAYVLLEFYKDNNLMSYTYYTFSLMIVLLCSYV